MSDEPDSRYAKTRNEVFSQYLIESKSGPGFLQSFATQRMMKDLIVGGVSVGDALVFIEMTWMAGKGLDHVVPIPELAKSLYRLRQSVNRSIRNLKKRGLVLEKSPQVYRFAKWKYTASLRFEPDGLA